MLGEWEKGYLGQERGEEKHVWEWEWRWFSCLKVTLRKHLSFRGDAERKWRTGCMVLTEEEYFNMLSFVLVPTHESINSLHIVCMHRLLVGVGCLWERQKEGDRGRWEAAEWLKHPEKHDAGPYLHNSCKEIKSMSCSTRSNVENTLKTLLRYKFVLTNLHLLSQQPRVPTTMRSGCFARGSVPADGRAPSEDACIKSMGTSSWPPTWGSQPTAHIAEILSGRHTHLSVLA